MSPEIRTPVALLSAGPHRPEVTAAADQLERQGQPVTLVCLDTRRHEHEATLADVLHVPLFSAGVLLSVARQPGRISGAIARLLGGVTALRVMASSLLRLPATMHLARALSRRGVTDVQGLDPVATKLASIVRQIADLTPPDLTELPVDWSGINATRIGLRWFTKHINSIVAEVSVDGHDERLIVKRQRSHAAGTAAERWAHESNVLRSLGESMGNGALGVPRVLLYDEPGAMVVMERARGTDLQTRFAAAVADRARMPELAAAVRGAGAWLAAMQAATRRERDGQELLDELVATAVKDVAKLAADDRVIRRQQGAIVQFLEEKKRVVSAHPLTVALHHDDYWPANIFFDGERVTVIDFESSRDGLAYEDPAYFLIRCHMFMSRFGLPFPDLAERFFEGYCTGQQPDRDALQLFTVTKGLRFLARGAGAELPMPQRIWTRRTLANLVLRAIRGA